MNSGTGIAAAISYPLGVYQSVPHGIGGGIFAPGIMKFNRQNGITKYNMLDYISGGDFVHDTIETFAEIGVAKNLSRYGIFASEREHLINKGHPVLHSIKIQSNLASKQILIIL